jgi:class 3 adenylate cyclase
MTKGSPPIIYEAIVVIFDIYASSWILEDLTLTGNLAALQNLIEGMKAWLEAREQEYNFATYKFAGDGWILLFLEKGTNEEQGQRLLQFLVSLAHTYRTLYRKNVRPLLEKRIKSGLTYGIDRGPLMKFVLGDEVEFIGRALNIASRLQGAVKDKGPPENRVLVSRQVYSRYLRKVKGFKFYKANRKLRNVGVGQRYDCIKINLNPHIC